MISDPLKSNIAPHHAFSGKDGVRSGLWRVLHNSKQAKVVVICHNSNASLKPASIVNLARLMGYRVEVKSFKVRAATTKVREIAPTVEEYLFICRPKARATITTPKLPMAVSSGLEHVWHPALKPAMALSAELLPGTSIKTCGDFFAGVGGFGLAAATLGIRCVFASEWDPIAKAIYRLNFGHWPAGDITKLKPKSLPDMDMICGGWPCQGLSIAGKGKNCAFRTNRPPIPG